MTYCWSKSAPFFACSCSSVFSWSGAGVASGVIVGAADPAESALDQGHDRVERRGDRLERDDQRDQGGAGGEAVLQQLQAGVAGGEAGRGDPGPDHGRDQERRTEQLGEGAAGQRGEVHVAHLDRGEITQSNLRQ